MVSALTTLKDAASDAVSSLGDRPALGTALIRAYGLAKIPMLWFIKPSVVEMTEERCEIKIPLRRRTKNHLGVMYIGVLVGGADLAGGLMAMKRIRDSGKKVHLLFKDLKVDFLKRVEGDAHFVCEDGRAIAEAVDRAVETGERVNLPMQITTTVPDKLGDEPVAKFVLTLTMRRR